MFNRLVAILFGLVCTCATVALPAWAADDVEVRAQTCNACHGQNGQPSDPKLIPIIFGQESSYLYKELHDYRSRDRDHPIMSPLVQGIAFDELRKLAKYYAAKPWPAHSGAAAAPPPQPIVGKMQQCTLCHGRNFEGGPPAPRLAGLSYEYLVESMRAFADGKRSNNLDMPGFMQALTDSERDAIARYLAAL
jgi:cytochrome c553